jgi:hypothetical protein
MTKDEALKMAIEALEKSLDYIEEETIESIYIRQSLGYSINACKEALEQPAQESVEYLGALPNVDGSVNLYFKKDQWQGLTDDEDNAIIKKIWIWGNDFPYEKYRIAIEQALKQKNFN